MGAMNGLLANHDAPTFVILSKAVKKLLQHDAFPLHVVGASRWPVLAWLDVYGKGQSNFVFQEKKIPNTGSHSVCWVRANRTITKAHTLHCNQVLFSTISMATTCRRGTLDSSALREI